MGRTTRSPGDFERCGSRVRSSAGDDEQLPPPSDLHRWPTALLELGGLRLLTDPTFDPAGSEYRTPVYVPDQPARVVYVSGDTVWYDGIAEASRRFTPGVAMLFMGAARVREVGPANLTLISESRAEIDRAFAAAGLADRLRWPIAGQAMELSAT